MVDLTSTVVCIMLMNVFTRAVCTGSKQVYIQKKSYIFAILVENSFKGVLREFDFLDI